MRRSGLRLAPWEVGLIEALDDLYLQPEPQAAPDEVVAASSSQDGVGVKSIVGAVGARRTVVRKGR